MKQLPNLIHLRNTKEEFNLVADEQELKGIEKYGKPLDPIDNYDWIEMAKQEQVDGFKYLIAEQKKRTYAINRIRGQLDREFIDVELIRYWLDWMEGKTNE
jgi:hypothetical protein